MNCAPPPPLLTPNSSLLTISPIPTRINGSIPTTKKALPKECFFIQLIP